MAIQRIWLQCVKILGFAVQEPRENIYTRRGFTHRENRITLRTKYGNGSRPSMEGAHGWQLIHCDIQ